MIKTGLVNVLTYPLLFIGLIVSWFGLRNI